ncbi:MAG: glycosyltransferase [Candidatus Cloacimonetes bacterium]|nr:glycosyltransferase [Candidatus Cloacimonadota bacterium]
MKILYYAPYSFSLKNQLPLNKAPRIRQYSIYHALIKDHDLYCISGDYEERKDAVLRFFKEEDITKYDGMYCESHNWPLKILDYKFFKFCKGKIPMTIFYRDCYWKTNDYLKKPSFNKIQSYIRFKIEYLIFARYFNLFFVPTKLFSEFCGIKNYSILQPAGIVRKIAPKEYNDGIFRILFAGNMKKGCEIIFDIMKRMLQKNTKIELHIFSTDAPEINIQNVFFHRTSLQDNKRLISKCHVGLIPHEKIEYLDLAFPLKIMDYLSYGLPVISTNTLEVENFLRIHNVGVAVEHDVESYVKAIEFFIENKDYFIELSKNALELIKTTENWDNRVERITNVLRELKK